VFTVLIARIILRMARSINVLIAAYCSALGMPCLFAVLTAQGGKADPYVEVRVHPPDSALMASTADGGVLCRTAVIQKDLNPRWIEPLVVPLNVKTGPAAVAGVHLLLTVMDHDLVSSNDTIGTACVSLARVAATASAAMAMGERSFAPFEEPLLLNGIARGRIRGTLELIVSEAVR
jgi:hypothetical protein